MWEKIKKTGLTENESKIYNFLLSEGGAYPSKIAEITKINRSTVYKTLLELSIKGLVNEIEKKSKLFYQIEKPENLIKYLKNKVNLAESDLSSAEKLLPELKYLSLNSESKPKVLFLEGLDTIKKSCNDMTSYSNYEMVAVSNGELFEQFMTAKDLRVFVETKQEKNITTRAIIPDTPKNRSFNDRVFVGIKENYLPKIKYVAEEKFPIQSEITIYGQNKVSITKLAKENLIGVIIEDKTIHDSLKMFFEVAWESRLLRD